MLGDNLPSPNEVIKLYKTENISLIRLYDPNPDVLDALRGSQIRVSLGVKNEDVTNIAMNVNTAMNWVESNVAPYAKDVDFEWITLGNEMVPSGPGAELISQAMNNIQSGLNSVGLTNIKVSTVVDAKVLAESYPPSAGTFSSEANELMQGIMIWLSATNNPILINIYPYLAFAESSGEISLDYALFDPQKPVVDGQYEYYSLFEGMVDAFYAAFEKIGGYGMKIVVSETGWPTAGNDPYTSAENARIYNQRLIDKMKHVGTPRRPYEFLDVFIFAMFNEDKKESEVEKNWGIHYPNMKPVYPLYFV